MPFKEGSSLRKTVCQVPCLFGRVYSLLIIGSWVVPLKSNPSAGYFNTAFIWPYISPRGLCKKLPNPGVQPQDHKAAPFETKGSWALCVSGSKALRNLTHTSNPCNLHDPVNSHEGAILRNLMVLFMGPFWLGP